MQNYHPNNTVRRPVYDYGNP